MKWPGLTFRRVDPNRDTVSDGQRQEVLRKKIFGVARMLGSGHIDFDTLAELVLATIPERSMRKRGRTSAMGRPRAA